MFVCVCVCVVVYCAGLTGLSPLNLMLVLPSGAARSVQSFILRRKQFRVHQLSPENF